MAEAIHFFLEIFFFHCGINYISAMFAGGELGRTFYGLVGGGVGGIKPQAPPAGNIAIPSFYSVTLEYSPQGADPPPSTHSDGR
jgi:hypothetical protein